MNRFNSHRMLNWATMPEPEPSNDLASPKVSSVVDIVLPPRLAELVHMRLVMGEIEYGTPLRFDNGRNGLVDMLQELLDCIVYAIQAAWPVEGPLAEEHDKRLQMLVDITMSVMTELEGNHGSEP